MGPIPDALLPLFVTAGWANHDGEPTAAAAAYVDRIRRGPEPEAAFARLASLLEAFGDEVLGDPEKVETLVSVCSASRALTSWLHVNPSWLTDDEPSEPDLSDEPRRALRRFVQARLVRTAIRDLLGVADMPTVGRELSDTADAAAHAALAIATDHTRADLRYQPLPEVPFSVIAMGKWGAQELNYASDIDVLFVYDTPTDADPELTRSYANQIASGFVSALADVTADGIAYRVDTDLRPEGRNGPLTRSLDSYAAYYDRWAATWEYQALIKARPAAGDPTLAEAFTNLITPHVYPSTLPPDTIRNIRTMKARIEDRLKGMEGTELKQGIGGIRDVEFAVQLLQLVHGRFDGALQERGTLQVLSTLGSFGYVREEDAVALAAAYRWLRTAEHRVQLWDLRQTHTLPPDSVGRRRVAATMGYGSDLDRFEADLRNHRSTVRRIHEALFYRPLLEAFAASPTVRLSADGTVRQLAALGYRDAEAARAAVAELTAGLSRRSRLMRQTLPLMLDWLSKSPDPDLGLEQLRLLVATTADHAQLIATLRDTPVAAERLCAILGSSRLLGDLLDRIPELLPTLADDRALAKVESRDALIGRVVRAMRTRPNRDEQLRALRRFVQARLVRTAIRDLLGVADMPTVGRELSDTADAAAHAALAIATDHTRADLRYQPLPEVPFSVIAMGKWGAQELNYASDIDVLFVYDTPTDADPELTRSYANQIASGFVSALADVTADGIAYRVDTDLRPEGRNGPLTRSLDSYAAYYDRWAATWEYQALIKARPAAGDPTLAEAFTNLITPHVYPSTLPPDTIRNIRTMKARIERERLPRDASFHLKLGPGGLSDIEFFTQLLQLRHGGSHPSLRTQGTISALRELARERILTGKQADTMIDAYRFCSRVRNRLYLQLGRPSDALPTDGLQGVRLGRSLGFDESPHSSLREEYRRLTRRARRLVERGFYRDSIR